MLWAFLQLKKVWSCLSNPKLMSFFSHVLDWNTFTVVPSIQSIQIQIIQYSTDVPFTERAFRFFLSIKAGFIRKIPLALNNLNQAPKILNWYRTTPIDVHTGVKTSLVKLRFLLEHKWAYCFEYNHKGTLSEGEGTILLTSL